MGKKWTWLWRRGKDGQFNPSRALHATQKSASADAESWMNRNDDGDTYVRVEEVQAEDSQPKPPTKRYWYECQEMAMAPGSGDGWPSTIRPQHSANARLVRRDISDEYRKILVDASSELGAIAAGRPSNKTECDRIARMLQFIIDSNTLPL